MNISECHKFINFWINKNQEAYYTPEEIDDIIDRGQMSLYSDYQTKYATSQRIKDSLSPFRTTYSFDFPTSINGIITVPSNLNYLDLLDLQIFYAISAHNIIKYVPISMVNEDVRAARLNSQVDPVTATSPIGELIGKGEFQLYPKVQYRGTITFFRRPVKPFYSYTTISGRVLIYDPINSVQLEWKESDQNAVLIKALQSVSINIKDADIEAWSQQKSMENFQNVNKT